MQAFTIDYTEQILLAATALLFVVQTVYYLTLYKPHRAALPRFGGRKGGLYARPAPRVRHHQRVQ